MPVRRIAIIDEVGRAKLTSAFMLEECVVGTGIEACKSYRDEDTDKKRSRHRSPPHQLQGQAKLVNRKEIET